MILRRNNVRHKISRISETLKVLDDFRMHITPDIVQRLEELYPNEIAMENYTRSLVMHYLEEREGIHT